MAPQIAVAIREATLADVPAMAEVTAAGFLEDDVFGKFIHPHRKQFPEDWNRFWQKEIRIHLMRATSRSYVCIESASGRVAAICLMNRLGKDASQSVDTETLESKIQKAGAVLLNPWDEEGWTDRSADPVAQEKFDKNWGEISHHFSGNRRQCWLIDFFCVYPDFQHKGIGSLLLQQAVELGMNEDPKVPVAVISSTIGDPFYTKFGFIQVGRANSELQRPEVNSSGRRTPESLTKVDEYNERSVAVMRPSEKEEQIGSILRLSRESDLTSIQNGGAERLAR